MAYESMSVQELRAESQRRGLGTARSRAELVERLTTNDADTQQPDHADFDDVAPQPPTPAEETPADPATPSPEPAASPAGPHVFRKTFEAEPEGPDEETHLAYRQATIQAAIDAGQTPRGDARLAETSDSVWVYEVLLRRVT